MPRRLKVSAAQLGPIHRADSRKSVVNRLIEMLKEADSRGSKFVVFPELALTTFFPRWWMEDQAEIDKYFEAQMPSPETQPLFEDAMSLVVDNRIFKQRNVDIGVVSAEDAIAWGFSGPMLRASNVAWDLRKAQPYECYAELDFEVPVGIKGDNYDRYFVRMREMDESVHMIHQLMDMLPDGPVTVDDRRCVLPEKQLVYTEIESLINHFKLIIDGPQVPAGDCYVAHESANGELGFYIVSTGAGVPWKVHCRAPSFVHMCGAHRMLDGYQLADIIPTFGSINMIGGECDR